MPYPLGQRDDGKIGRRMIKIPLNVLSSCQRVVSHTILPRLEPWITWFVARCLIHLVTGVWKVQAFKSDLSIVQSCARVQQYYIEIAKTSTLLGLEPRIFWFKVRCLSIRPTGRWKIGKRMIKIPINILSSCQKAVSLTILQGLKQRITWFIVRCLIHWATLLWLAQAVFKI